MPNIKAILDYLSAEWGVIASAPLTFFAQMVVMFLAAWLLQKWAYGTVVAHKDGRIAHLEERIKIRDDQLSNKVTSTPPDEAMKLIEALQAQLDQRSR